MSYAILRPTVLVGTEDILINNIAYLMKRFPFFGLPGDGSYRLQPIVVDDLADLVIEGVYATNNYVIDAVGPRQLHVQGNGGIDRRKGRLEKIIDFAAAQTGFAGRTVFEFIPRRCFAHIRRSGRPDVRFAGLQRTAARQNKSERLARSKQELYWQTIRIRIGKTLQVKKFGSEILTQGFFQAETFLLLCSSLLHLATRSLTFSRWLDILDQVQGPVSSNHFPLFSAGYAAIP